MWHSAQSTCINTRRACVCVRACEGVHGCVYLRAFSSARWQLNALRVDAGLVVVVVVQSVAASEAAIVVGTSALPRTDYNCTHDTRCSHTHTLLLSDLSGACMSTSKPLTDIPSRLKVDAHSLAIRATVRVRRAFFTHFILCTVAIIHSQKCVNDQTQSTLTRRIWAVAFWPSEQFCVTA